LIKVLNEGFQGRLSAMILVNGKKSKTLDVSDRGLQYGDGVWETIPVHNKTPSLLSLHLERLERGLKALKIHGLDTTLLKQEVMTVAESVEDKAVMKIIITRGSGGRGYNPHGLHHPSRIISLHPWPEFPQSYVSEGINLGLCKTRLAINPALAGFKHLNRLEQILAREELDDSFQEGLVCDYQNNVIEGTMSNVFLVRDDQHIITPELTGCGIAGIIRSCIIELLHNKSMSLSIQKVSLDDIKKAEGLFMTNSVIGIWPVRKFAGNDYTIPDIIPHLQQSLEN
jgi:4-amino-4-deoxychorismate lyase